ncbi:hypothetical protein QTO34_005210 [Cnephaeus nilssonii]|uniref:G-protein coupled receptors family 1 profile domain-containing protein n=1 Tax=Cnephaeus nilssonii TaxID=3371016 RepID=A0AA40HMY5_CNENI|nr:hypothetical protein QTO34_005210 [Eptesicus nilssonii]
MYTVVTPMLNPFIYSLRNRDIKQTLEMCANRGWERAQSDHGVARSTPLGVAAAAREKKPQSQMPGGGRSTAARVRVCDTSSQRCKVSRRKPDELGNSLEQKVSELTMMSPDSYTFFFPSREKSSMRPENQSSVSQFLLLGLPIPPGQQGVFFTLFLGMYLTTVLGNLLIILLIRLDSRLHTPMYVAICHPLHYSTIMSQALCTLLVAGSWMVACVHALIHTLLLVRLSFCADNTITHFFCDLTVLLKLSCSDISLNNLVIFTEGGILYFLPLSIVLGSYIHIGTIILRAPSTKRLSKAFSTCVSHLSVVSLYYGTLAGVYFFSSSWGSKDIIASVMYTVVTPMLNPFIYSLRSRDIKQALEMCMNRISFLKWQSLDSLVAVRSTRR